VKSEKAAVSSDFLQSGRRDLNSGPPVPQAYTAFWRAMVRGGGTWLRSWEISRRRDNLVALCGERFSGV
jgi:hypothetical protein